MLRVYQRKNPLTSLLPRRFTPSATVERIERRARSKRISPSCCTMGMAPAMRETPAGPGQRQPPDERDSGPKGADSQVHEKWSGFAEHGRLVEVFNKDAAAQSSTRDRQTQESSRQVIVLDAADEYSFILQSVGDGAVHGHALIASVQGRRGEGAIKATRGDMEMTGLGMHEPDARTQIHTLVPMQPVKMMKSVLAI